MMPSESQSRTGLIAQAVDIVLRSVETSTSYIFSSVPILFIFLDYFSTSTSKRMGSLYILLLPAIISRLFGWNFLNFSIFTHAVKTYDFSEFELPVQY